MFTFIFRSLWRLIIFTLGAIILWVTLAKIYPYVDSRLPPFFAFFILYCAFVYGIVPLLIRLFRIVIKPDHIPLYVTTGDGWPSDPVNIALIVRNKRHLVKAMRASGWHLADPLTFRTGLREIASIALGTSYPEAPLSNLYLFNRPHDVGFEVPTNPQQNARTRHHVRFWRLEEPPLVIDDKHLYAYNFWHGKLKHLFVGRKEMWIGAATEETHPIDIQWHTGQLTHGGSHESDKERDFIIQTLADKNYITRLYTSEPGEQIRFRGQQVRTFYVADGSIRIARLR